MTNPNPTEVNLSKNMDINLSKNSKKIDLPADWLKYLQAEFEKDYMLNLKRFLNSELKQGKTIYPKDNEVFTAFNLTPLSKVKVVIFGQDPYHGSGQAHGLCFSVKPNIKTPPSLVNIYKELQTDVEIKIPIHGHLTKWAEQGVLLLNTVLTVEAGKAASHQNKGWEKFTDKVVETLNHKCSNLVFLLWGNHAQKKGVNIDATKHKVFKSSHPSPLSAYRVFWVVSIFQKLMNT